MVTNNPALLAEEDLLRGFVVRERELAAIMETLDESLRAAPNRHMLVTGATGSGKTTLVQRAALAAEAEGDWIPVVLPEEAYGVASAAEFWLEAVRQLAPERYLTLRSEGDDYRLETRALAALREQAGKRRVLLIVENLDMLLSEQIPHNEAWRIRKVLQTDDRILLMATAVRSCAPFTQPDHAFYGFFRRVDLDPLGPEEIRTLWEARTHSDLPEHRVRPLEILTQGNARLVASLAQPGTTLEDLYLDLMKMLDAHTSTLKARIESLPSMERRVFVALAGLWSPSPARDVAAACRLPVNKVSALLHRLEGRELVRVTAQQGRTRIYEVGDRELNLYYLMRQGGEPALRLRDFLDSMARFYGGQELGEDDEPARVARRLMAGEEPKLVPREVMELARDVVAKVPAG